MKQRRFDQKNLIRLAEEYVNTSDDTVFERLMAEELDALIGIQLGKNYMSVREFWEDMKQEVMMYLWKNRETVKSTKSRSYYQFYYIRIRGRLNHIVTNQNRTNRNSYKTGMKISSYDSQNDAVIAFDNLSLKDKKDLGLPEYSDEIDM